MNTSVSYAEVRDEEDMIDSPCEHPSTHRETVSSGASWNPMTQDVDDKEYLIEVCDVCDEEIVNEYGEDDYED